ARVLASIDVISDEAKNLSNMYNTIELTRNDSSIICERLSHFDRKSSKEISSSKTNSTRFRSTLTTSLYFGFIIARYAVDSTSRFSFESRLLIISKKSRSLMDEEACRYAE